MLFIDENSQVDKESLRIYVLSHLKNKTDLAEKLIYSQENKHFWDQIHNLIPNFEDKNDKKLATKALRQIQNIKSFLVGWQETAVDSQERMELFIQTKAAELKSGDEKKDYYWAMQIRHDQLVALIRVTEKFFAIVDEWLKSTPESVLKDPVFRGLGEDTIEDQIFLESESIHKQRQSHK